MPVSASQSELDPSGPSLRLPQPPEVPAPVTPPVAQPFDPTELLSRVWQQSLPLIRDRLANLDRAAEAATHGALTPGARTEASDLAHKLAGSLGMFGYPKGTEIAREIEELLEAEGEPDSRRFLSLTQDLRAVLSL